MRADRADLAVTQRTEWEVPQTVEEPRKVEVLEVQVDPEVLEAQREEGQQQRQRPKEELEQLHTVQVIGRDEEI